MLWKTIAKADKGEHPDRTPPTSLWFWLEAASEAAAELLSSKGEALEVCKMLVDFGRRRGRNFLKTGNKPQNKDHSAFFGLFNPHTLASLSAQTNEESAVQYYRSIAAALHLSPEDLVIAYNLHLPSGDWVVLATALPQVRSSNKRNKDGKEKKRTFHMRWVLSAKYVEAHTKQGHENGTTLDFSAQILTTEAIKDLGVWRDRLETLGERVNISTYNEYRQDQKPSVRGLKRHAGWSAEIGRASGFEEEFLLTWYAPPVSYLDSSHGPECTKCLGDPVKSFYHEQKAASTNKISFRLLLCGQNDTSLLVQQAATDPYQYDDLYEGVLKEQDPSVFVFSDEDTIKANKQRFEENHSLASLRIRCIAEPKAALGAESASKIFMTHNIEPQCVFDYMSQTGNERGQVSDEKWISSTRMVEIRQPMVSSQLLGSLHALSFATAVYCQFQDASVPMKILESSISTSTWYKGLDGKSSKTTTKDSLALARSFACVAMFESGGLNLQPEDLTRVFAMSSGNSLFVAEILLRDPAETTSPFRIRRITGNIGRPGISLLVSPKTPRTKDLSQDFMAVAHADYDFRREHNFRSTTTHLGFTEWHVPLLTGEQGFIDSEVFLIEGVVSVRDRGEHVADLDIISALHSGFLEIFRSSLFCKGHKDKLLGDVYTSLDSWDELLEPPEETVGIVRAHNNWVARLAATCIIRQRMPAGRFLLVDGQPCWSCLEERRKELGGDHGNCIVD